MKLEGESGIIEISILGRSHVNAQDYWDANWLDSEIKVEVYCFKAHYITYVRVDDLQRFYDELIKLEHFAVKQAEFTTMEEGLHLLCTMRPNGSVLCTGTAADETGNILKFALKTDLISIGNLARQLKSTLNLYPIIGK